MVAFEIIDKGINSKFPDELQLAEGLSEFGKLLRLLIGSASIQHCLNPDSISVDHFFFREDCPIIDDSSKYQELLSFIGEEVDPESFKVVLNKNKFKNINFYTALNQEIAGFLYYKNKTSYTTAFLFLYRIIEMISYAIPMIYTSKTSDFIGTYDNFKNLFKNDAGELGFFKKFLKQIYKNETESSLEIEIIIDKGNIDLHIQQNYFDLITELIKKNGIQESSYTEEPSKVSIKFTEFGSFLISVRNRFFHNKNGGQKNIQLTEIIDPDLFFEQIVDKAFFWICSVILELIKYETKQYV